MDSRRRGSIVSRGEWLVATLLLPFFILWLASAGLPPAVHASVSLERLLTEANPTSSSDSDAAAVRRPAAPPAARAPLGLPQQITITTDRRQGSQLVVNLSTGPAAELTIRSWGLSQPLTTGFFLLEDPTGSPFDALDDIFYTTISVPAGSTRLAAEILDATALDVDLFLGSGSIPSAATLLREAISPGWEEQVNLLNPSPGLYWVAVQNVAEGPAAPDPITLAIGVVPGLPPENFSASGPKTVLDGVPFALELSWNEPRFTAGLPWYGLLDLGPTPAQAGQLGTILLDIRYTGAPEISIQPATIATKTTAPGISGLISRSILLKNGGSLPLTWDAGGMPVSRELPLGGGFETGGWLASSTLGASPLCTLPTCGYDFARSGGWYAWFGGWGVSNRASISRTLVISSGQDARLSFYLLMGVDSPADRGAFAAVVDGRTVFSITEKAAAQFQTYQRVDVPLPGLADGRPHEIRFSGVETGTTVINFFLDDVSLTVLPAAEICTPADGLPWLSLTPPAGSLGAGQESTLVATFDLARLPAAVNEKACLINNTPGRENEAISISIVKPGWLFLPLIRR